MTCDKNSIKNKIIEIFSLEKVKNLQMSPIELFNLIKPYMDFIHSNNTIILSNWLNDENDIIKSFVDNYNTHYKNNEKLYIRMDLDRSFVASIMMYVYH